MQVKTHTLRRIALISAVSFGLILPQAGLTRGLADAMQAAQSQDWDTARREAGRRDVIAQDLVEWHRLRAGEGSARDVLTFLDKRADWPGLSLLRRRSEATIARSDPQSILRFFEQAAPQTGIGALAYGEALIANGRRTDGRAQIIQAWRTMAMPEVAHQAFLSRHGSLLRDHHADRTDYLLWDNHAQSAGRMLPLLTTAQRALAEARIALQEVAPGVDGKIEAIPARLQSASGLAYDRFAWRDGKRRQADAIALMMSQSTSAKALGQPAKWLRRRRDFARQEMRDGNYEKAYQLAAFHFSTPADGYGYVDCEWIAGYVALRFLRDPELAVFHFDRFLKAVETPISIGRGGYWLGLAYGALDEVEKAHVAMDQAAQYQTSFYGLLAAEALGRPFDPGLANPSVTGNWREAAFLQSSVAQAGLALLEAGELTLAERFLTHLVEGLPADQAALVGQIAVDLNEPHLAVMISKRAARDGVELKNAYFPLHPVAGRKLPMAEEMTLAISRRESEFDPSVVSHAGARGLMQLMPATAQLVAGELGISDSHRTGRLTQDWQYNAQLGAQYLAGLADEFNGNVVMMAAGYNAGPHRPKGWMERYGDPRDGTPDIIDWIEHIPFNETRNYVMRVTESLPVYRARLGKATLPQPFSQELAGSTLHAFTP
ncbi:lytic transglycosylase domain-containing protein [Epibacterium ulvae]|uniref:lytic transglycosylase domain-containing protein n=1 Tax=Epibacterium ulvae TaxID=1156985 RepID=UPI001BFC0BE0|nr:lytic transglycosylase domain-containing protein [Epibacterium ulvae]MBT8153860.1 lytic transglycosylase domain-containing protein [Epibacterium ulvae]